MLQLVDWYSDGTGALMGLVLLGVIIAALLVLSARKERFLATILPLALAFRFFSFLFNVFWLLPFYGEGSDAFSYHRDGIEVARLIRDGAWNNIDWGISTKAMPILQGLLYTPFGADINGVAFLSSVLGLGGIIYTCRAFGLWVPPEQARKYAILLFFMPSMAMWTGIVGKDSWMALGLGLAAYGYSAIQKVAIWSGIWHFIAGFSILTIIRPHIALAVAAAMTCAYAWGTATRLRGAVLGKVARIALLTALIGLLYPITMDFVGLRENASVDSIDEVMLKNSASNAELGGSVVEVEVAPGVGGFLRALPRGVVRILLEPFPWEITNPNNALAAAENVLIGIFILLHVVRPRSLLKNTARSPYALFSLFLTVALLMMLSLVPNLGLLSRQRVQLLPFLFAVLVAGEPTKRHSRVHHRFSLSPDLPLVATHKNPVTWTARQL